MGNNKITNLGNPGSANDAVSKRFLYKRIQKLTNDFSLESVSGNINSIKNEIVELRQSLLSNRNIKSEMRSFKSNENIHKKEGGSYYVVSANKHQIYLSLSNKVYPRKINVSAK